MARERRKQSSAAEIRSRLTDSYSGQFVAIGDFPDLPPSAVASTFSRMSHSGDLKRVQKGLYYMPEQTELGPTTYTAGEAFMRLVKEPVFPAGTAAANTLGFSTQNPMRPVLATPAHNIPTVLGDAIVYPRRPDAWKKLASNEGAVLSFLRDRGKYSELTSEQTCAKLLDTFHDEPALFKKLVDVAESEPARVRAMLGAIGEALGEDKTLLDKLKATLSPFSKYDFGTLSALKYAKYWQAQ